MLTVDALHGADAAVLRAIYGAGYPIIVLNGQVSRLAQALGVDVDLPDLLAERGEGPILWVALLMAYVEPDGSLSGQHAHTDFIDGAAGLRALVAQLADQPRDAAGPRVKASCAGVTERRNAINFNGPGGSSVAGFVEAHCAWDSVNSRNAIFGYAYTAANGHDEVKMTMVVFNNCDWWHQVSTTTRTGTGLAEVSWPGLSFGLPSCGNKWLANVVHSARKGTTWFSTFNSACAGSGC